MLLFFIAGCSTSKQANNLDIQSQNEYALDGVELDENIESVKKRLKNELTIQNYRDISDLKECENAKNIIINNFLTNIDTDNNGVITSINTVNPKVIDANGVSVGQDEKVIKNLVPTAKSDKIFSGDDSLDFYEYKIQMKNKKGYYEYIVNNDKKIDSITISSNRYIACFED